jgi:signal transduction histidine kinase/ligand-binding sensor domain-containing protein
MKFPKRKKCFSLVVFLSVTVFINYTIGQNIKLKKLSVEDGLSNSYVNCLLQDKVGFIWFGTDDGLNRYDGYEIKVYRNITEDSSSLSNNIIWSLFEDHSGNLWIGTKGGKLNRYDPFLDRFEHCDIDSNATGELTITYIFEDSNNFIWIGTYRNGLYRFDQSQNKFDHWKNNSDSKKVLSGNFVISIIEDNYKNIWIGTYDGLDKYNPDSPQNPFTQFYNYSENSDNLTNNPIWYLSKSSFFNNSIWIGSLNGLIKFAPLTEKFSQITLPESSILQFGNSVSSVVEEDRTNENILWVGTYGGLVRYNLTTGEKQRFIKDKKNLSGLLSNQINELIIDNSSVVWIATDNGINIYSPKLSKFNFQSSQISFPEESSDLLNKNIRAVTQTNDQTFWFGTERGLVGLKNINGSSSLIDIPELKNLNVWSLFNGNSDNIWIGTYGQGLKELNNRTNKLKSWNVQNPAFNALAFDYVMTILQDTSRMLWIGFWGGGLARLNPLNSEIEFWRNEINNPASLSYNDVWALHQDLKGRVWIGTNGGGLDLFNNDASNSFYHWRADKKNKSSLSSNNIYTICESINGNLTTGETLLWVGTANGLNKFVIKNDFEPQNYSGLNIEIKYYTVDDGLPDNSIESILEDENGNLWIGTSSGISFFNVDKETFINFSSADGLNGSPSNSSSAFKTKDGLMLFGCTKGLNYFNPYKIAQSSYSPPVIITDFKIFNQPGDVNNSSPLRTSVFNTKEITLSYFQNDFSFQFASLDYNSPEMNRYAYMMEGFDNDWIYCGTRRFVTYTNLDPGEYVFQVKATNSDGLWSKNIAKIFIVINPPFWQTWWAYTIYVIAFIGGLYFIREIENKRRQQKEEERLRREREAALLREAKLKAVTIEQEKELEKQKIRNRISQDLHDEIGSNLSSISLMSELVQKDGKINRDVFEKIQRIHKVAKGSSQAMRDIVWLTNPSSDNIKDFVSKMNEVANDMLAGINWKFDSPEELSEIDLTPEAKRNVFLIFKEALTNIIKHSGAKNAVIRLKISDDNLLLAIKDDGKGFNADSGFGGNGLKNMRNRAKEIGGKLELKSNSGEGTKLVLEVNITQVRD